MFVKNTRQVVIVFSRVWINQHVLQVIPEVPEDVKVMTEGPVVPIDHR